MRAIRIHGFGGIDTMRLDEIPRPMPGAGESTTTRRPHANTISIRLATPTGQGECGKFSVPSTRSGNGGKLVDEASRLIIAGANVAASSTSISRPARASRRQVNNWLADNPFRRAVADTTRGAL